MPLDVVKHEEVGGSMIERVVGRAVKSFERFVARIAPYRYHLKCYFMQKPVPEMSDDAAIRDIQRGIDYLATLARKHAIPINIHLNPTYVGGGTRLETAFREGRYVPPRVVDVAAAVRHARGQPLSVFIGLHTEGLAVEGGSPIRPEDKATVAQLEVFNRTQDHDILDRICAAQK